MDLNKIFQPYDSDMRGLLGYVQKYWLWGVAGVVGLIIYMVFF